MGCFTLASLELALVVMDRFDGAADPLYGVTGARARAAQSPLAPCPRRMLEPLLVSEARLLRLASVLELPARMGRIAPAGWRGPGRPDARLGVGEGLPWPIPGGAPAHGRPARREAARGGTTGTRSGLLFGRV